MQSLIFVEHINMWHCIHRNTPSIHDLEIPESTLRFFCEKLSWLLKKFYDISTGKDMTLFVVVLIETNFNYSHMISSISYPFLINLLIDIKWFNFRQSPVFGSCQQLGLMSALWIFYISVRSQTNSIYHVTCLSF